MKKIFFSIALAVAALMPMQAQNMNQKGANAGQRAKMTPEQVIEMKTNRVAKKLMLDDATTAKFAPIYKEYLKEMQECAQSCPKAGRKASCPMQNGTQATPMTDDEIAKQMEACMDMQQKKLDVKKSYYKKLKSVLNMKQMQALFCKQGPGKNAACCGNNQAAHCGNKQAAQCGMKACDRPNPNKAGKPMKKMANK